MSFSCCLALWTEKSLQYCLFLQVNMSSSTLLGNLNDKVSKILSSLVSQQISPPDMVSVLQKKQKGLIRAAKFSSTWKWCWSVHLRVNLYNPDSRYYYYILFISVFQWRYYYISVILFLFEEQKMVHSI